MSFGIDYAFNPHPPISALKTAGVTFVGRYTSTFAPNDGNGKNLTKAELGPLLAAGLHVVLFAEEGGSGMLGGHGAGVAIAQHADAVAKALGMPGIPVYFTADFDATEANQTPINAYLDGAASVIGRSRVGLYGGYWPTSRARAAGKATYYMGTIAWSGDRWNAQANPGTFTPHIMQGLQVSIGGVSVDVDHANKTDYGQWPRPKVVTPTPDPQPGTQAPVPPASRVADGRKSLRDAAHAEGTTVQRSIFLTATSENEFGPAQRGYIAAGDWDAIMPKGMIYVVG